MYIFIDFGKDITDIKEKEVEKLSKNRSLKRKKVSSSGKSIKSSLKLKRSADLKEKCVYYAKNHKKQISIDNESTRSKLSFHLQKAKNIK